MTSLATLLERCSRDPKAWPRNGAVRLQGRAEGMSIAVAVSKAVAVKGCAFPSSDFCRLRMNLPVLSVPASWHSHSPALAQRSLTVQEDLMHSGAGFPLCLAPKPGVFTFPDALCPLPLVGTNFYLEILCFRVADGLAADVQTAVGTDGRL
mmetsp:Transcript_92262/g.164177  ORF Transcript_92262/g.164177 Transcript_92262/m.164177 type:complete len:151 (+) Transcript_92262:1168-1620(+)